MQLRQRPLQTPQPNSKDPVAVVPRLCIQGPHENQLALYSSSGAEPMSKAERAALLVQLKAGEHVELEFEAITFIQRETPNRNFVRFQPGTLPTLAKSFAGQPFLMNHDDYDVSSRGGTILASKLEHNDDGSKQMRMRVKAVKGWAVEGLLDGTIDRFSIAWDRGGVAMQCSIHLAGWYECSCRLGQRLEDGRTPELLVTGSPVGTEMSAVNVPAVVGTHIGSISQLEAIDDPSLLADILGRDATGSVRKEDDMKTLATMIAALGLPADSTEETVSAAVQANAAKLAIAEKSATEKTAQLAVIEAERVAKLATEQTTTIETAIAMLKSKGKLKAKDDPEETELRAFAAQSMDVFAYAVKTKLGAASVTPAGARLPAATVDPQPSGGPEGVTFLRANPETAKWLSKAGISEADFEKHGKVAREMHAAMEAAR